MFYNDQPSSTNNWSSNAQYASYQPDRRSKRIWILVVAIIALTLSVAALIIVFAVEHAWFSDSYNPTSNNLNYYGLWRLCFFANQTCDSWFSTDGPYSSYIYDRLNQAKTGINAWQALEIVFLFLITSTLIISVLAVIFYRLHKGAHYYLSILTVFCVWPAACIGIASLFVFGFSVYNVSPSPHYLGWCFYVNIAAVVLSLIGAILLTIYNILFIRPKKLNENDAGIDRFTDLNSSPPALNPSTYVIVPKDKKKRKKTYDYPQVLSPHQYYPNRSSNSDYVTNPNYQMLSSYNQPSLQQTQPFMPYRDATLLTSPSMTSVLPSQTRYYPPPPPPPLPPPQTTSYPYQSPHWHRTETTSDYIQRGIYRPTRPNLIDQRGEPRVLHYYTGHDHFSTVDPSDIILTRPNPPYTGPTSSHRYNGYTAYYPQSDFYKSAM